jgi:hypothetical protein
MSDKVNGFWKIRLCPPGSILHLASSTEPVIKFDDYGRIKTVVMPPPCDRRYAGFHRLACHACGDLALCGRRGG